MIVVIVGIIWMIIVVSSMYAYTFSVFRIGRQYNKLNDLTYDTDNTKMIETTIAKYKENLVTAHINDSLLRFSDGTDIYIGNNLSCYGVICKYLNTNMLVWYKLPRKTFESLILLVHEICD